MGFFDFVGDVVKSVTKPVIRALPKPIRSPVQNITNAVTSLTPGKLVNLASKGPTLGLTQFVTQAVAPKAAPYVNFASNVATALVPGGGATKMALNIPGILNQVGGIFGGSDIPAFNTIGNLANLAGQFVPAPQQTALAVRPAAPAVAAAAGAMVSRGFFSRFPNLALAMQQLRARGHKVKRSQLWSLLKRFGPEALVGGGLLTAAAVNELMIAGPGRRSMNAANPKALRRAARRIKSFHKMCGTIDLLKSRGKRSSARCGTCRKSPCRC